MTKIRPDTIMFIRIFPMQNRRNKWDYKWCCTYWGFMNPTAKQLEEFFHEKFFQEQYKWVYKEIEFIKPDKSFYYTMPNRMYI